MASTEEASSSDMTFEEFDLSRVKLEGDTSPASEGNENANDAATIKAEREPWSGPTSGSLNISVSASGDKVNYSCADISVCCVGAMKKILESDPPMPIRRRMRLVEADHYSASSIIARTRDLLEDFCTMKKHPKSVKCAKFRCVPRILACKACGMTFSGRGGHLLQLMNHTLASHVEDADELIIQMIHKFRAPLSRMRQMLLGDWKHIGDHLIESLPPLVL